MHFYAFYYILENLNFNEVITCRQVCRQWKEWIDQYLRTQTTLLICFNETRFLNQLYVASQVLDLDYDQILAKRIHIPVKELSKKSFTNSIVSMFPNILHFYFCSVNDVSEHISYDINRQLLYHWHNLETLMIFFGDYKSRIALIEQVNELESLKTLIVVDEQSFVDYNFYSLPKNAEFLARVEKLYVPSLTWIDNLELQSRFNITSLGTNYHKDWERYQNMTDRKLFPNVEALNLLLEFNISQTSAERVRFVFPDFPRMIRKERLNEWVNYFKEKNNENIRLLSFVDLHGSSDNIEKSFYSGFLKELEAFKKLKILKFDACHFDFFECILSNAQFYSHVRELYILIKFMIPELPEHVDRFRKAFPAFMRSVEKVFLRPVEWLTISKDIKKVVFDDHSYQVIFQKSLEYN